MEVVHKDNQVSVVYRCPIQYLAGHTRGGRPVANLLQTSTAPTTAGDTFTLLLCQVIIYLGNHTCLPGETIIYLLTGVRRTGISESGTSQRLTDWYSNTSHVSNAALYKNPQEL